MSEQINDAAFVQMLHESVSNEVIFVLKYEGSCEEIFELEARNDKYFLISRFDNAQDFVMVGSLSDCLQNIAGGYLAVATEVEELLDEHKRDEAEALAQKIIDERVDAERPATDSE